MLYIYVFPYYAPSWTVWIVGTVCLSLGCGMGYGAAKWKQVGIAVQGFALGSLVGYWIYTMVLKG